LFIIHCKNFIKNKFPAIQFAEKKFTKIEGINPISMSANT